jgi:N-acyl-D-aspartate/D-glutamate deacylase
MLTRLVRDSGRPLSFSLGQRHSAPDGWRQLLALTTAANAQGLPMAAQVAPRPIGVLLGLQGSRNPFSSCPGMQAIAHLSLDQRVALLRQPATRARILAELQQLDGRPADPLLPRFADFSRLYAFGDPPDYEPPPERAVTALAQQRGQTPAETAYDLLLADNGRAFLFAPFANYAHGHLDACHDMLAHPHTVPGLGDGGAHVSVISDGSFPTYLLSHWGRDRAHSRFDLGWLVKRQTADTARTVGLYDRGLVAPGYRADLNVIDMDRLRVRAPVMANDLPAGGQRLLQRADGYDATIVAGVATYRQGEATGALPGQLVRGPQAVPVA